MKSSSVLLPLFALLALAAATFAWLEHQELVSLRATQVGTDERAELQKRVWDAQKRIKDLQAQLAGPPSARRSVAPEAAADGPPPNAGGGGLASAILSRMNGPEAQRLIAEQMKVQIERRFARLFDRLNLPADQLAHFKDLLVERQSAPMDILSAASDQGVADPQDFQKLVASEQSDIDSQIQATLGPAAYSQYQDYQQTQAARNTIGQLQASLSKSSTPLSSAQAEQMTQMLAQTSTPAPNGAFPTGDSAITDAGMNQAQAILSAPQVQALQAIQQQQRDQARLRQIMLQRQSGAPTATPAPPAN